MHLHLELRRIARDLNSIFEIQMVLKTASYFIYLTVFSYQLFLMIIQDYKKKTTLYTWLVICSWIFPLTINLYVINYIYDNVEYKAKKTCTIIHQLTTPIRYADMWKEFALQEMHRPLKFTGLDLFQFGHKFIWKDLSTCLRKLSVVDDTLQVLGTPKEYRLLYKWTIGVIIGWIILACFLNTIDSIVSYYYTREHSDIVRICVPFFTNHLFHVDTYSGLIWGTILGYTGSRFQRINEHIYTLLSEDTKCIKRWDKLIPINYQSRAEAKDCKRYIWIIMHIHLHLSHISHQLNKVFSMQMTLQMASYFAFFVDLLCVIYTSYIDKSKNIGSILDGLFSYIWLVVCIVKVFGLTHICQTVSDKAQETITILYKLSNDNPDEDLREQVLQFILQIKQREIKFSGLGLFYFDYGFIRHVRSLHLFCKSIVTILIIIIQMHVSYDDISQPVNDEDYIVI
ncbi:uncharacterized protein LOC105276023 isoform X2 [Ooceraea biroi]|uniref:uncharacterized protein LOC105276023 isoform X2 n=1 Tax=Ooceraea biroi TaxID=2015173 RepID=UPI000F07D9D8|nr:uncharacterized protein LOC105276023 isoform X2 [Ooceraea biroi]